MQKENAAGVGKCNIKSRKDVQLSTGHATSVSKQGIGKECVTQNQLVNLLCSDPLAMPIGVMTNGQCKFSLVQHL